MKTWKQNLKHLNSEEYSLLREMCHLSKNIYNESVYNIRQHYFSEGTYLRYEANYYQMKDSKNYSRLGASVAQQTMRGADASFKSFFGLLKLSKQGKYESWKIKLPGYLEKEALHPIKFAQARIKNGYFLVPLSQEMRGEMKCKIKIKIPKYLEDKSIHQIHIIPKYKGKYFEARYIFDDVEIKKPELDKNKALGIDFGINNLCTCVTSEGKSFIIDGRKLKSINQWYNKENARLQSIKDKQKIKACTKLQYQKIQKRNNQIQDYIYKSAKIIIQKCLDDKIGNLVIGYNDGFQNKINLGKVNNQNFSQIPLGRLKDRLEYLCGIYGINYILQEESYTSKASFFDGDQIPKWNAVNPVQDVSFSGKRIKRGLYKRNCGKCLNADINGALNILKKSNAVSLTALSSRGEACTPYRIRPWQTSIK